MSWKSSFISEYSNILLIHDAQSEIFHPFISFHLDDDVLIFNENTEFSINYTRPTKRLVFPSEMFSYWEVCPSSTQCLVGASSAWLSASMRLARWPPASGTAKVFLLRCVSSFSRPSRFPVGSRVPGEFAGQSSPVTQPSSKQLLVLLTVWAAATSSWKMQSASPSSFSAEGSRKCSRRSRWTAVETLDSIKPDHHGLWKLHAWILFLSALPPDPGTLISKWKANIVDHWATSPPSVSSGFWFSSGLTRVTGGDVHTASSVFSVTAALVTKH